MWAGIGAVGPLIAAAIIGTDRRSRKSCGGHRPSRRTLRSISPLPLVRWRLSRLTSVGAVHAVAGGRYYLDEAGWTQYRWQRRRRALVVAGVLVAALGILWWTGRMG